MYNFNIDTLMYFARIRHLKGTFRSNPLYGFGEQHDPCIVMVTIHEGVLLSCTIYNRFSRQIENTVASSEFLRRTTVSWTLDDVAPIPSDVAFRETATSLPDLNRPEMERPEASYGSSPHMRGYPPFQGGQPSSSHLDRQSGQFLNYTAPPAAPMTPPPSGRGTPHSDRLRSDAFLRTSGVRMQSSAASAPPMDVLRKNSSHLLESFASAVPHRLRVVPGSEVLQWESTVKSIYMRTNGINTIGQIAIMISLTVNDVLQVLLQLEKDEVITLERPSS